MASARPREGVGLDRAARHGFLKRKGHRALILVVAAGLLLLFCGSRQSLLSWPAAIALPAGAVLVGLAGVGRLWATLYHAGHKNNVLITEGPYSVCRNPMYMANIVGGLGVTLATVTITAPLLFILAVALHYRLIVRREEERLRLRHGARFESYRRATPAFLPAWRRLREPESYLVRTALFRARLRHALWPALAFALILLIDLLHLHHDMPTLVRLI